MAADNSMPALLAKLTASLSTVSESLPAADTLLPPENGISLLDVKSELLLSYLQNLVFLILVKLRNQHDSNTPAESAAHPANESDTNDQVVQKLAELRVYLEKGVRPLENKLKYQIDKVTRAADTADRDMAAQKANRISKKSVRKDKPMTSGTASDSDVSAVSEEGASDSDASIDELAYRPNPAAFVRPSQKPQSASAPAEPSDGIYRPPRITPTSLPTTIRDEGSGARSKKPLRSSAIDDYVSNELSTAPGAEPSIGSTIVRSGRGMKSAKEREEEAERTAYEESNFVRLPKESKKEMQRKKRRREGDFGGEDLRGLGEGAERIGALTAKGGRGRVEKAGYGGRMTVDGPRGDGFSSGFVPGGMKIKKRKMGGGRR